MLPFFLKKKIKIEILKIDFIKTLKWPLVGVGKYEIIPLESILYKSYFHKTTQLTTQINFLY